MALFRRRPATPAATAEPPMPPGWDAVQIPGLAEVARTLGWERVRDERPVSSELADEVHRLSWTLHGQLYSVALMDAASAEHRTIYREVYAGHRDDHRFLVANAWTQIAPSLRHLYNHQAIAICAVERCRLPPLTIHPRHLPSPDRHMRPTPTGDGAFDEHYVATLPFPDSVALLLTPEVRGRILAHDDWAFTCMSGDLLCASTGDYGTVEAVTSRVDEVMSLVAALETAVVPQVADAPTAALIDRIGQITTLEEALAFLAGLAPKERELLAESGTPIASFAHVTTQEEAIARFMSLGLGEKARLLGMMRITDG